MLGRLLTATLPTSWLENGQFVQWWNIYIVQCWEVVNFHFAEWMIFTKHSTSIMEEPTLSMVWITTSCGLGIMMVKSVIFFECALGRFCHSFDQGRSLYSITGNYRSILTSLSLSYYSAHFSFFVRSKNFRIRGPMSFRLRNEIWWLFQNECWFIMMIQN